jgi:hypothetical protein
MTSSFCQKMRMLADAAVFLVLGEVIIVGMAWPPTTR